MGEGHAERRRWRAGCLQAGAVTARTNAKVRNRSQRDSAAAGLSTRRSYISMNRAGGRGVCHTCHQRGETAGTHFQGCL